MSNTRRNGVSAYGPKGPSKGWAMSGRVAPLSHGWQAEGVAGNGRFAAR
ncbi:MAG: hypothetical protein WA890_23325 [Micromonospora sp.]